MSEPTWEQLPWWRRWVPLVGSLAMVVFWGLFIAADHGDAAWIELTGWKMAMWVLLGVGLAGLALSLFDYRNRRGSPSSNERSPD